MITVGAAAVAALIDRIGDGDTPSEGKPAKGTHDAFVALLDASTAGATSAGGPQTKGAGSKGAGSEGDKAARSTKGGDPTVDGNPNAQAVPAADAVSTGTVAAASSGAQNSANEPTETLETALTNLAIPGLGGSTDAQGAGTDPTRPTPLGRTGDGEPTTHPRPVAKSAAPADRTTTDVQPATPPPPATADVTAAEAAAVSLTPQPSEHSFAMGKDEATPGAVEAATATATATPVNPTRAVTPPPAKESPTRIEPTATVDPTRREPAVTSTRPTATPLSPAPSTGTAAGSTGAVAAPAPTGLVAAVAHVRAQEGALPGVASQLLTVIAPVRPVPAGGHTVTIALQPEGLGTVRAAVTATNDQLLIRLTASSVDGDSAVRASLPELHLALSGTHQTATVTLTGDSGTNWNGNAPTAGDTGGDAHFDRPGSPMATPSVRFTPTTSAPTAVSTSSMSSSSLDVRM